MNLNTDFVPAGAGIFHGVNRHAWERVVYLSLRRKENQGLQTGKKGYFRVKKRKKGDFGRKQDTPDGVLHRIGGKARKMALGRRKRRGKKAKKILKTVKKPLAREKRFVYNPSVVCSGMKW